MELKENIAIKYHLGLQKLSPTYPTDLDIEMDILLLLLEYNKKKKRKNIKGDLPVEDFQQYYESMSEENQPKVLQVFKTLKDTNQAEVVNGIIVFSNDFIYKYIK